MKTARPLKEEYPEYYEKYISKVETDDPVKALKEGRKKLVRMISKLNKKQLAYRYEEGKWTIKEILVHLIDSERVFGYRALTFARNDKAELPGFDEKAWVPECKATDRKIKSILSEYEAVRDATMELLSSLSEEMLSRSGVANGNPITVRSLAYIIPGHEVHHMKVIKERYLHHNNEKEKSIEQ